MMKADHHRRFDTLEKTYLHIATAMAIGLLGWQATNTAANKNENIKLNTTMTYMVERISHIEENQQNQTQVISGIKRQVSKMCDRQNMYWDGHQIECE